MAQTRYAFAGEARDPRTAAMLSMVPGLGQFYNGDSRKGVLFLDVAIINYLLLGLILLAPVIAKLMHDFGVQFGMKVNSGVLTALKQMEFGSPVSLVVTGMIVAFVAYAVRDAYDHALVRKRRAIYKDAIIGMPEAASGSYIFHASLIVALAIMALFFFIPKPPAQQMIEIEVINSMTHTVAPKVPVKTVSTHNNVARTRTFDQTKPIQKLPPKADLAKQQNQNQKNAESQAAPSHSATSAASAAAAAAAAAQAAKPAPTRPIEKPTLLAQAFHPPAPAIMPPKPIAPIMPTMPKTMTAPAAPATPNAPTTPNMAKATPIAPTMPKATSAAATPSAARAMAPSTSVTSLAPRAIAMANPGSSMPLPAVATPGVSSAMAQQSLSQLASGSLPHSGSAMAMPSASAPSSGLKNAFQMPTTGGAPQLGGSGHTIAPHGVSGTTGSQSGGPSSTGAPGPVAIETHGPSSGFDAGPVPTNTGHNGRGTKRGTDGSGSDEGPAPVRPGSGGHGFSDGPIRIVPSIPGGGPASHSGPADGPLNVPKSGPDAPDSTEMPDFARYMEELQRRIKRSWFPPKDAQSKKVKVMFKVHTNGEMSNLRISFSSHDSVADQAALKAVENAAPFQHLPAHSPENVDIEFTFDYNVLSRGF